MNRRTLLIVIGLLVVGAAGAYFFLSSRGGDTVEAEVTPAPVVVTAPFVSNLADTDSKRYLRMSIALEIAPLPASEAEIFANGVAGGGHEGAADPASTPAGKLAADPLLRHAVIMTATRFTSAELLSPDGKETLLGAILSAYNASKKSKIAKKPAAKGSAPAEQTHVKGAEPEYKVTGILLTDFAIQ